MTLLFFGLVAGILSFLAYRSSYYIMKIIAAIGWVAVMLYWMQNPPSAIVRGTPADTAVIMLLGVVALAFLMWPWFMTHTNGNEVGSGFRINMDRLLGREESEPRRSPDRAERVAAYRERLRRADKGER
jgi:hypothetical protein